MTRSARAAGEPGPRKAPNGAWILVVDDDKDMRESVCDLLTHDGYKVTTAADGFEALKLLRFAACAPDLMLLDMRMRGGTGWDVLATMRDKVALARMPVIVLSGHLSAAPQGAVACLGKPVCGNALLRTIAQHLPGRAAGAQRTPSAD